MADDDQDEGESVATGHAGEEELVPLSIGLEVGDTSSILFRVPLENVHEKDFIHSVESDSAKR